MNNWLVGSKYRARGGAVATVLSVTYLENITVSFDSVGGCTPILLLPDGRFSANADSPHDLMELIGPTAYAAILENR